MYRQRLQPVFRLAGFPVYDYGPDHFKPTKEMVGQLRTLDYADQWRTALIEKWYHARLEDHSLLIFDDSEPHPSYSYLHCPLEIETMRDFLGRTGRDYNFRNIREAQEEYEQIFETSAYRANVTPIRYDIDMHGYLSGSHPLGHLHIGLGNSIRLGVRRVLSPVAFSLFVMRQMYPESWKRLLGYAAHCRLPHLCRTGLPLVGVEHWQANDEIEAYLV